MTSIRTFPATLALAAGLAAGAFGCANVPEIMVQEEPSIRVPAGAVWAWRSTPPVHPAERHPAVDNEILRGKVEGAIERALGARGLVRVDAPDAAQFLVSYHVGVRERRGVAADMSYPPMWTPATMCGPRGCGSAWGWGYYGPPVVTYREYEYLEGGLVLDVLERATNRLAWRGILSVPVTRKHADQSRLDELARELVARMKIG
jgi:hypothetical protein